MQLELGNHSIDQRNYAQAIAEYQTAIDTYPESPAASRAQYNIGISYKQLGSYSKAIVAFEKVMVNYPQSPSASKSAFEIGQCWYAMDNPDRSLQKAISAYERVPKDYPKSVDAPRALYWKGQASEELLDWQKAVEAYQELLQKYPESADAQLAQLWLGSSLHKLGKYGEAVDAYDKILNSPGKFDKADVQATAQAYKAESLYEMGQYEKAAEAYLRVSLVYFNPDLGIASLVRAGDSYEKLGRWSDAVIWYRKVLKDYAGTEGEFYKEKKSEWDAHIDYARKRLERIEAVHAPGGDAGE